MLEILKKSSKTGDRFTAISDLQTMRSMLYLELGIGNSIKSFQSKFMVPRLRYKNILVSRDKDTPPFLKAILENFNFHGKLNSFEIP